ncbi:single-stranded DNA-binding protein [Aerococcaceae bacterium DSM 111176]|nr:single-stranded DNA-binding protein [Aerococcaceae bacterium DSM 111176]
MNQAMFVGRLTKDIVVTHFDGNARVVNNILAVQRFRRNQKGEFMTDFIPINAWGGLADLMAKYCQKGQQIAVNGRMQSRSYDDKSGAKKYVVECIIEDITLLSGGRPANQGNPGADASQGREQENQNQDQSFDREGVAQVMDQQIQH